MKYQIAAKLTIGISAKITHFTTLRPFSFASIPAGIAIRIPSVNKGTKLKIGLGSPSTLPPLFLDSDPRCDCYLSASSPNVSDEPRGKVVLSLRMQGK